MNRLSFFVVLFLSASALFISNQAVASADEACTHRTYTASGETISCGCDNQARCPANACDLGFRKGFRVDWALGWPSYGYICEYSGYSEEPETNVVVPNQENRETLWGWSDVHEHQFANLAYGGTVFWGAPYDERGINAALARCDYSEDYTVYTPNYIGGLEFAKLALIPDLLTDHVPIHGTPWTSQFIHGMTNNIAVFHNPAWYHHTSGTGLFKGWPNYYQGGHQQMYYKWLERAYRGGMRLLVNLAVNNEALCWLSYTRKGIPCRDMNSEGDTGKSTVDLQIQAMEDLEDFIEAESRRKGEEGWYRIAYSATDARQIISEGKMAVVIGIEVDTLFGCDPGASFCDLEYVRNQIKHYWKEGVRYIFPVHFFDNKFAGGAQYSSLFTTADIITDLKPTTAWNCAGLGYTYDGVLDDVVDIPGYARCNALGLTTHGIDLLEALIDADMIIDVDHLSHRAMHGYTIAPGVARKGALAVFEGRHRGYAYPPVTGHPMILETPTAEFQQSVATVKRIRDIGGIAAVNMARGACNTTYDIVNGYSGNGSSDPARHVLGYSEIVELMNEGPEGKTFYGEGFPGISLSTDMGAFNPQPGPRYSRIAGSENYYVNADCERKFEPDDHLAYPFGSFDEYSSGQFKQQKTGDRTFDYNTDGLAHIGLMPDLVADMMNVGLEREELDPLFNSAETFVRMWERIENCTPDMDPPTPDVDPLATVHGACSATVTETPTASDQCIYSQITGTTTDPLEYHDQGIHTVTWHYMDEQGNSSTQKQLVSVIDNVPPVIEELSASPDLLWPPTNQMVSITVTAVASDNCDAAPFCRITAVSSNESDKSSASKNKVPDWQVSGDLVLDLRAEKAKSDMDRVYDIEVTCTDYAGNDTTGHSEVRVPHDQDKKSK